MKPLSRFLIVSGSILCLLMPKKISKACGWYVEPGEYRFWILQPGLANVDDLSPFFLASTYTYRDNWQRTPDEPYETNIDEWYEQVGHRATRKDIEKVLYDLKPDEYFLALDSPRIKNSFIKYLKEPANRELLAYMWICKQLEAIAANPDPWEEQLGNAFEIKKTLREADSLLTNSQSPFIRLRTAYQMMRLQKYGRNRHAVLKIYDSLVAQIKSNSYIKAAALYERAICTPGLESDYILSKVFDQGYRRKYCILFMASDSVDKTLRFARNAHERSVLHTMAALNSPGRCLRQIKNIYNAEPAYRDLPFLLIREINKTEDWLLTRRLTEYPPATYDRWDTERHYTYQQDLQYARELYAFLETVLHEGKNENQHLTRLLAAHLSMVLNDYAKSQQHLDSLKNQAGLPANFRLQLRVNELLLQVLTQEFDEPAEKQFLEIIHTPDSLLPVQSGDLLKDQLTLFIAKKLMEKGSTVKGIMLLSRTNRSFGDIYGVFMYKNVYHLLEEKASPRDYDAIINILEKKEKTAFEKFIAQSPFSTPYNYYEYGADEPRTGWDKNKLLDLKATWYIRNDSLEKALTILEKLPDSLWWKEPYAFYVNSDPFSVDINSGHNNDRHEPVCNRLDIVKEMIRLQKIAKQDSSKAALCYLQLGNAHFNLTWYGKNWLMVKQWWSVNDRGAHEISPYNDIYFGCTRAREYYLKAAKLATDKKLASLSCFHAFRCQKIFDEYRSETNGAKTGKRYIALLKEKGFEPDYYNEMIEECATYEKFRNEVRSMQP